MEKKGSCLRARPLTILWGVLAILLCGAPSLHAEDITGPVTGPLFITGTTNLLPGASVSDSIYVLDGGTLNIYAGTIPASSFISVSAGASMTVYGTDFAIDLAPVPYGVLPAIGMGTLTGTYADTSLISLWIFSDAPINLVESGGQPPEPEPITIDIKPGSEDNSINLGSFGVIPVAILSTAVFDATALDPDRVFLAGAGVAVRGKGNKYLSGAEDVDGDGLLDLVVKIDTVNFAEGVTQSGPVTLEVMNEYDEPVYQGTDDITIVPPD